MNDSFTLTGKMTMDNGRLTNCMCYATFTGRLVVYYDMDLTSVTIKSASEMAEEDESILSMLKKMGIDGECFLLSFNWWKYFIKFSIISFSFFEGSSIFFFFLILIISLQVVI